jgi:hypothetical protein
MGKGLFVVCVDNYFPALAAITLPSLERYANKIGATFTIIDDRKFPDYPPAYEKMQIYERGKDNNYNILIDCDIALRREMYDVTELIEGQGVGLWMWYPARINIAHDEYVKDRAFATNFVISSKECHDVWKPFDLSLEEVKKRLKQWRVADEYCFSRNVHRLGIKPKGIIANGTENNLMMHSNITTDSKDLQECLQRIKIFLS